MTSKTWGELRQLQMRCLLLLVCCLSPQVVAETCVGSTAGEKAVLWGDLHVHTSYSLDAYAFGSIATPKDAYAYAKGQPLLLANGTQSQIDRPLDFAAVTDHAETFDLLYLCSDPIYREDSYCSTLRQARDTRDGRTIFNDYLLPIVGAEEPQPATICDNKEVSCAAATSGQWRRTQFAANEANDPCNFTALIGYEWTASPGGKHWHRNVIFRSEHVPDRPIDYVRYPQVSMLWRELDAQCKPEQGCQALAIPHNINWADGGRTFTVENEDTSLLALRARFERLAEMHQEKGNSECLPQDPEDSSADCGFERLLENAAKSRLSGRSTLTREQAWQQSRSSYYRTLLSRGLQAFQRSGGEVNPLMLGAIASTDNHFGTAGRVAEAGYRGSISSLYMTDDQVLSNTGYNPGGLVAVWAEQNTRSAVFDALYRREAYATSGPRITLQFAAGNVDGCIDGTATSVPMGGVLEDAADGPLYFTVNVHQDATPIARIQLVKGELWEGRIAETVVDLATFEEGVNQACVSWPDAEFNAQAPGYWYARVLEQPTPRWSKLLCEQLQNCAAYPEADTMVEERAWSSPIWHVPVAAKP